MKKETKNKIELSFILAESWFKLKNEGSYIGIFWYLLNPLLIFLLLYTIFSNSLGKSIPNYSLYIFIGISIFNLFQQTTQEATKVIFNHRWIIKSINIPSLSLIGATVIKQLYSHTIEIIIIIALMIIEKVPLINIIFYPLILIIFCLFIYGVSLALAALTVYFLDLENIWSFAMRLLWLATPIFYNLEGHAISKINLINPIYYFIEISRNLLINSSISWTLILGAFISALVSLIIGNFIFSKLKNKFAEHI